MKRARASFRSGRAGIAGGKRSWLTAGRMKFSPFLALLLAGPVLAADPRGDHPDAAPSTPQEQLAKFTVPPGFEVQLVADETQIQKPMNLNFDAAGRLWVTGSALYPWPAKVDALGQPIAGFDEVWKNTAGSFDAGKAPAPPGQAIDSVRVLSDFGPDGRARKVEIFADGLNIPIGVQPLPRQAGGKGDRVIVFSIPTIWRMEDTDGDGRADKREALYTGFDFKDTHGMSSNYLYWIDGWIYGCHGFRNHSEVRDRTGRVTVFDSGNTYRFRPDGSQIEVYTHGQTNPFGLTVDPLGNFYSADSHSKPVMLLQRGGFYAGIGKNHDGLGFAPTITDDDHGSSAIAGIAYYADDKFPAEFRDNLFNGNPVTRRINRARLEWQGATPKAIRMPDFLTCDDPWFRPIQVKLGPDGALYIADFYNPIIGHYEFPLADPRRDHKHGRIWRVVYRGGEAVVPGSTGRWPVAPGGSPGASREGNATSSVTANAPRRPDVSGGPPETTGQRPVLPLPPLPVLTQLDAAGLVERLADPNLVVRTLATHELVDRVGDEAIPSLRLVWKPFPFGVNETAAQWAHALIAGQRIEKPKLGTSRYDWFHAPRIEGQELARILSLKFTAENHSWADPDIDAIHHALTTSRSPMIRRAAWELFSLQPPDLGVDVGAWLGDLGRDDPVLTYQAKLAVREYFKKPFALKTLDDFDQPSAHATLTILESLLAVPTPEAAEFLLAHLRRTGFANPRSADFLKHAALHVSAERFGAVAELFPEERAPARPTSPGDHGRAGTRPSELPLAQRLALADALGQSARQRDWKLPDDLAAWTQRTVFAALDSPDAPLSNRAIAALREVTWPEKFAPLEKIVLDPRSDGSRRAAALEAALNLDRGPALAAQALVDPTSLPLRKKAAELLGRTPSETARAALLGALPTAPAELALSITASLAKTDPDFSALLDLLEAGKTSPAPLRHRLIAMLITQRAAALRTRADALTENLPPEDARLDQLIAARTQTFASAKADPSKGAQVFSQNCAACHRFRNLGGNVGPNLDGVGARGPTRLIEDILDPNRNVDPLFRQTTIETTSGEFHVGANLRDQGETLLLADTAGREVTIAKTAIKAQTGSALSLMPAIYETALAPGAFHDLIAYLLSPATETPPANSR